MRLRHRLPPQSRLMQSIPSWVDPNALLAMQFGPDRYWRKRGGLLPSTSVLATTRASGINIPNMAGVYQSLGINTLPRTDRGLNGNGQIAAMLADGNDLSQATWSDLGAVASEPLTGERLGLFKRVRVASTGGASTGRRRQILPSLSALSYQVRVYYEAGSSARVRVRIDDASAAGLVLTGNVGDLPATLSGSAGVISEGQNFSIGDGIYLYTCIFTPASAGAGAIGIGPDSSTAGEDVIALGIDVTDQITDAWVSGFSPLLASDIRAVQGVRPDTNPEPVAGWEAAGLDNAFGINASVKIDRLNAASARTIAAVHGADEHNKVRLYLDTDNRIKAVLTKLGPEIITNWDDLQAGDWILGAGWSVSDGKLVRSAGQVTGSVAYQEKPVTAGRAYVFTVDVETSTGLFVFQASAPGADASASIPLAPGVNRIVVTATAARSRLGINGVGSATCTIKSFSVREAVPFITLQSDPIIDLGEYEIELDAVPGAYALRVSGGVAGDTDVSVESLPAGSTALRVGSDFGALNPFNGWIKELQILKVAA